MSTKLMAINEFTKHRGPVTGVAQVGETSWVITSGYDNAVARFNFETGDVELLGYHKHLVNRIVVDSAGLKGASCSSDYTIGLWDLQSGTFERSLVGHSDDVEDFVFVDSSVGISASRDKTVIVWDLNTGNIIRKIMGHDKDVLSLAALKGKIYSTGDDMTLRVWDLNTGEQLNKWGPFDVETDTCAIDLLRERVVLGCDDGFIRIFNIFDGAKIHEIEAHTSGIKKVSCSPVNGNILSAAYDQRIRIWDAETFEEVLELDNNPIKWERSLVWSTNGEKIFAGTFDGTMLIWEADSGRLLKEIGGGVQPFGNSCFNEATVLNNSKIAAVSDDGYVRLIDLHEGHTNLYEPESGRFLMNAVASSHQLVVTGAHNQRIHFYNYVDDKLNYEREVYIGEGPINSIRISDQKSDESTSFVGCYSGVVAKVDRNGTDIEKLRIHDGAVKSLRLHPELSIGISCSAGGELLSWDFNGNIINRYIGHEAIINDVDINESGSRIASVSRDFTLKIYEVDSGKMLHSYLLGSRSLKSVCYYNDEIVIVGDYWGFLIAVSIKTGEILTKKVANNGISSVNKMGDYIIASSYDGSIYQVEPMTLELQRQHVEMQQVLSN